MAIAYGPCPATLAILKALGLEGQEIDRLVIVLDAESVATVYTRSLVDESRLQAVANELPALNPAVVGVRDVAVGPELRVQAEPLPAADTKAAAVIDAVRDAAPQITMHVRLTRVTEWRARVWLTRQLIRLAAWVSNVGLKIDVEGEPQCESAG